MTIPPACVSVLDKTTTNAKNSLFNEGNGLIYLLQADECWAGVLATIDNEIALANESLEEIRDLHYETDVVEAAIAEIASIRDYSDGLITFTQWQWDQAQLDDGDAAGVCVYQRSSTSVENAASCWVVEYNAGSYSSADSYLIKPSKIGTQSTINSFEPIDDTVPMGTKGAWLVTEPEVAFNSTRIAFAARFNPAESSPKDPALRIGNAEVVTYLGSRALANSGAETTELIRLQQASNHFSQNNKWQSEQVEIKCYSEDTCADPTPTQPTGATSITTFGAAVCAMIAAFVF